nr:uncharacterized protein LOC111503442 [Leptinotarsa decemlineata]
MLDDISKHLSCLEGMKLSKDTLFDMTIIHVIYNKLDKISQNKWKEHHISTELPTLDQFLEFLKERQDILQSQEEPNLCKNNVSHNKSISTRSQVNVSMNQIKCNFCKRGHSIYTCQDFLKLPINERWSKVVALKLCSNCLRIGHSKDTCNSGSCRRCRRKHNTLLHNDIQQFNENTNKNSVNHLSSSNLSDEQSTSSQNNFIPSGVANTSQNYLVTNPVPNSTVLLSTVTFKVKDSTGKFHKCRALLDSGAQSNLITKECVQRLNLPLTTAKLSIIGINQVVSNLTQKVTLTIFSNINNSQFDLCCYVTPFTCSIPSEKINTFFSIPENICLSDPEFYLSQKIDMIIGSSLFWDLLVQGNIKLGKNGPILQNTKLGWVVAGATINTSMFSSCNFSKDFVPEDKHLRKFWEINEVNVPLNMSKDDIQCEELFLKTTTRDKKGQFIVKLPLKHSTEQLGDSKETAINRFLALEKRFQTNVEFYNFYRDFIHEYLQLGHMTKIETLNSYNHNYYLPHHGILKESSITTKLRVVFDGSCPTSSGWSLNDLQYVGPKVQNDIFDILIRFRLYKYVVSADVSKMYRQIWVHPDHRPLQLILWRDTPNEALTTYQLNTVTYGTTSAPYLAIKCLNQLAIQNQTNYPIASKTILSDFYVDDLLTGSNDLEELQGRCKDISSILRSANFILRKWSANDVHI